MSMYHSNKYQATQAVAVVKRIQQLADDLVSAISEGEGLKKYRFASSLTEKEKAVEAIKLKYAETTEKYDYLNEELETKKKKLNNINFELQNEADSNESLRKEILLARKENCLNVDDRELANNIRLQLQLYKKMTGVHFDCNAPENDLSGFIAFKQATHYSALIPFIFKKDDPNISSYLWEKIGEALPCNVSNPCKTADAT